MENNSQKKPADSVAKIDAKITYAPRLDAYSGKVLFPAKLKEAKEILASLDYDSLPEELKISI